VVKLKLFRDKKNISLIIGCDGAGSSGKSTGSKLISKKYKLNFLSSGLLYRYASYLIIKYKPKKKIPFLKMKFKNLNYKYLNRLNLHTQEIDDCASIIAKQKKVRFILKVFQKKFAKKYKNICIEGRDICSEILKNNPRYDLAFFFKCKLTTAAYRRWKELRTKDNKISLRDVKKSLKTRNELDVKRRFSPLIRVKDSILIRTDILNKRAMVVRMSREIEKKLKEKYGRNL